MNPSTTGMKPKTKLNPIKEEPMCIKISVFLEEWAKAKGNEDERRKIAENLWFDWFCSTKALYGKTKKFVKVIKTINTECTHADRLEFSLKNNCPARVPSMTASASTTVVSSVETSSAASASTLGMTNPTR